MHGGVFGALWLEDITVNQKGWNNDYLLNVTKLYELFIIYYIFF